MKSKQILIGIGTISVMLLYSACVPKSMVQKRDENKTVPKAYGSPAKDSASTAEVKWRQFFTDSNLVALIDTALKNNQELNIMIQEITIAQNEIRVRKGDYLPFVDLQAGAGVEKTGRYTRNGSVEHNLDIEPEKEFPEPLPDFMLSANVSWEIDIWKKLRNAKKAATLRYLSTVEGRNFMITNLVAEIARSYFELMALDNQLTIVKQNIEIQQNALRIVKREKESAQVTELAVRKFEAEVFKNQSNQFYIQQQIIETENRINFLVGRYPQPIKRNPQQFISLVTDSISTGIPSQLLANRPDIRQAELNLEASKLDVKSARANFYPSVRITAGLGTQAFNPAYLAKLPESMLYSLAGDLIAPLVNRNAIKAIYFNASAKQVQAVYDYERTILNAYIEVANQVSNMSNLKSSYAFKEKQVEALTQSINISISLFISAKADYMEVLLTQRDALEARMELIETKKEQLNSLVTMYQVLGGGWK